MVPRSGWVVKGHRLDEPLHCGEPGKMWLATRQHDRRIVVLRFVDQALVISDGVIDPRKIASPAIAQTVTRAKSGEGMPFVVYELGAGETLEGMLERLGAPEHAFAAEVTRSIAAAISAMHGAGMKHGDVRPDNVYLERTKHGVVARLLDHGLRTVVQEKDLCGRSDRRSQLALVAPYLSPERVAGKALTRQADLWALAVMAYEMLTGDLPFIGGDVDALLGAIASRSYRAPSEIDDRLGEDVDAVFERAFHAHASERHQSARQLADALLDALVLDDAALDDARRAYVAPKGPPSSMPVADDHGRATLPPRDDEPSTGHDEAAHEESIPPPPMRRSSIGLVITHVGVALLAAGITAALFLAKRADGRGRGDCAEPSPAGAARAAAILPPCSAAASPGEASSSPTDPARLEAWPNGVRPSGEPETAAETLQRRKDYGF
jgi:serine/threonine protein kinase